jgi:hypothetical protein
MAKKIPSRNSKKRVTGDKEKLAAFLANNPYSQIHTVKYKIIGEVPIISKPWNDNSLILLLLPQKKGELIDALNKLILPPRFTAIYHIDTNDMEYIFTRLKPDAPILSRRFIFNLDNKQYSCKFDKASERLMNIVSCYARAEDTKTDFRNLAYLEEESPPGRLEPVSFYVSGFDKYDEEEILEISKYLNFFTQYYDRGSPAILVHPPIDYPESLPSLECIEGGFPNIISTRRKDPFLMDFILAACDVGSRLQFIYCYQLLEYAAFYYVDDKLRQALTNIVTSPDIHSNPDKYVNRVLATMADNRMDDEAKVSKLINETCSPEVIYKEIEQNKTYFSTIQKFEGGFVVEPFISTDTTLETFRPMWETKTANALRFIRNALVHGREKRLGSVISPTPTNDILIRPWCCVVRRIAEQVILFG